MGQDYEVDHWAQKFGVRREKLREAVNAADNIADAVEEHLK